MAFSWWLVPALGIPLAVAASACLALGCEPAWEAYDAGLARLQAAYARRGARARLPEAPEAPGPPAFAVYGPGGVVWAARAKRD